MGLFGSSDQLKCKKSKAILSDFEILKKHQEKVHDKKSAVCETKFDTQNNLRKHKKNSDLEIILVN